MFVRLTAEGYAAASIDYRLDGLNSHPKQIHDCKGAIRWLRANAEKYGYDVTRIGVGGGSAGGHLVLLLGLSSGIEELEGDVGGNLDQSSQVHAVVDLFGPSALDLFAKKSDHFRPNKTPELLKSASPVTWKPQMNSRQLQKLGVPDDCVKSAIVAIQNATKVGGLKGKQIKQAIKDVVDRPEDFTDDEHFGQLAQDIIADREFVRPEPIEYRTWGSDIDKASHAQMKQACGVPMAAGAALMPDAHVGYGLPIGGVLALENAVIPYAVGVDIACRMKLSVLDLPPSTLDDEFNRFKEAIEGGTRFGIGSTHEKPQDHAVMDQDWSVTRITREKKDLAWSQLGTSGSGNHFVDVGVLDLPERDDDLGLDAGQYVAIMSHSGSRGPGAAVCHTYSGIARSQLPAKYEDLADLSWLSLDSEAGQEYWAAMNLTRLRRGL
jgi:hypothetical protein